MVGLRLLRPFLLLCSLILILQVPGESVRASPLQATTISINMSNPSCAQVSAVNGACSIEIGNVVASGSDPSFSRVEVLLNGKLRVYMAGFFESSAYFSPPMLRGGLIVACGKPNAGGLPGYGKAYLVTANAYMVDGTSASDSMTVYCPAFEFKGFSPLVEDK
jgi:hypothetical protein